MKTLGGNSCTVPLSWLLVGNKQSASHPGRLVLWTEPRFPFSRWLDGQMRLTNVIITDAKIFRLDQVFLMQPPEIYASSRGYRQFQVSALQCYDSPKALRAEDFVGLNCLVGCNVGTAEPVGTSYI